MLEQLEQRTLLADLSIIKTGPTEVIAGEEIIYGIFVLNEGPDTATGAKVVDTLPPGLTYLGDTNPNGCTTSGSTVTCDLGTMLSGDSVDFKIKALVAADFVTKPYNEVQTVTLRGGNDADTFSLTFNGQTTAALAKTATGADVQTALEALSNIGAGNVAVTGSAAGPYVVTFQGTLGNQNVAQMTSPFTGLLGASVRTTVQGDAGTAPPPPINSTDGTGLITNTATVFNNEVQLVTLSGAAGTFTLAIAGQTTAPLATTATAAEVQTALENLSTFAPGDVAVTGNAGGPYTVTFQGTIANANISPLTGTGFGGALANVQTINQGDSSGSSNNSDTVVSFVEDEADLVVTKFVEPSGTARTGEIFIYTIFVDNLGPSAARNVVIFDTLLNSAQVEIQSCAFSVSQGGGAISQFTCTTGPVVSTQFGSGVGTFATNFLVPVGAIPDPMDPTKSTPVGRLRASFRLLVKDGETDGGNGGAGGPNDNITLTNTTRVVSDTPDPNSSNNFVTADLTVIRVADLGLTMMATGEEQQTAQAGLMFNNAVFGQAFPTAPNYFASIRATAGRRIKYELTVSNTGPSDARNVVVSDLLPAGVRIYQGSLTTTKGTCDGGTPGEPLDRIVCGLGTLDAPHPMANPAAVTSATITFEVIVDASTPAGAVLINEANVTSDTTELDNDDNQAHTENTVLAAADLTVSKTSVGENVTGYNATLDRLIENDVSGAVTAGKVLRYEISVQNNGPSDSQNVTISDALPSTPLPGPVTFLRADGADCRPESVTNDTLFCSVGTLAAGDRRTFDVYVFVDPSVPAATVVANCVTALTGASNTIPPGGPPALPTGGPTQSLTFDPLTTNNTNVCTNTTVNTSADLEITKSAVPPKLLPGEELKYHIRVENFGPSAASNVIVTDTLPVGVEFEFDTDNCTLVGPVAPPDVVECSLGTMQPGEVVEFDIVAEVTAATPSGVELCNTAVVSSDTTDFKTSNNTAVACNFTIPGADLSVTKSGPATINPGTNITYTITVSNAGPTAAINAVLEDFIPAGERTLSVTPATGNCLAGVSGDADRPTTCNLGTISAGDSVEIVVVVEANNCLEDLDQLFNDVVVRSDTFDEDTSNNVYHSTTEVRQSANGNVTAVASRGNLFIVGDNFNNTLRIDTPAEAGPHALRITPFGGTLINGECRSVQVHGVKGNVSVRMGRANDTVLFDGPITLRKSLKMLLGQGNDTVSLSDVSVSGITSIRVDGDHDVVSVIDSVLGSLSIRAGKLGDSILLDGTHVLGTTSIRSDGSIDSVRIVDSIFDDDVLIQGGRGSDTLDIGVLSNPNANGNDFNELLTTRGFENVIS